VPLRKIIGTASARTSGASNASGRRAHHLRHYREEEKKEKKTPLAPNQLSPAPLAPHKRSFLVRFLPTNSPLRHSPAWRPPFVRSPRKESVPHPTSMGSAPPLALSALVDLPTANSSLQPASILDAATQICMIVQQHMTYCYNKQVEVAETS